MNDLSLIRINENSSYTVSQGENDSSYRFYTEKGVHYSVSFLADELITSDESYQLIIANLNHQKSPRDIKVRNSILAIVDEFFYRNQSTLLYICETGDGKQGMRNRLFEYWFHSYKYRQMFTVLTSSIIDEEGIINFATLIVRNDNPKLSEILAEFAESVRLLNQKPD